MAAPLLSFVRPGRLQLDPVGGILGALAFHAVLASTRKGPGSQPGQFAVSVASAWRAAAISWGSPWPIGAALTSWRAAHSSNPRAGTVEGRVYRLAPPQRSHGVVAPYGLLTGHDVLFRIRADGQLAAVTEASSPEPRSGDTVLLLGPVPGT